MVFITLLFSFIHSLGISGDKIEIDPVRTQPKNTANMAAKKFWGKQKAVSIESDRLADCLITEEKPSGKWTVKVQLWFII